MAFDGNGTRFLLYARRLGADFSRTAMIGRQRLQLSPRELDDNLRLFGERVSPSVVADLIRDAAGYSESFLRHLGAGEVHSFDCTAYERATHVHDMNLPISPDLKERYSTVIDGGSLEHVFNFPVGVRNGMEMVAIGGHYVCLSPGNNFMGHGFYQFSPELFFRLFDDVNGFRVVRLIACESGPRSAWFTVRDPAQIGKRVGVSSRRRVTLLLLARRMERRQILQTAPQQSDYTTAWSRSEPQSSAPSRKPSWRRQLRRRLKRGVTRLLKRGYGPFDPRLFERLDLAREVAALRTTPPGGSGH